MREHKKAKNMFPMYTNRHIFKQSDRLHARGNYIIAFPKIALVIYLTMFLKSTPM
jgi:hypothetical protein